MPPQNNNQQYKNLYSDYIKEDSNNNQINVHRDTIDSQNTIDEEDVISKKFGYFHVYKPVENDKTVRYIFIDESKYGLVWPNIIGFTILHCYYIYTLYLIIMRPLYKTWLFHFLMCHLAGIGVTVGAHRLWAHRGYQASLPLRIFLMICFTISGQNDLMTWVRDHRVHHKFTETDADPHNSLRGMFFAHVGWLLTKKHPDVLIKGRGVPIDDLKQDSVVQFNRKYYIPLYLTLRMAVPFLIPILMWNENFSNAMNAMFSAYIGTLNATWFVNSAAHLFGDQPYNNKIQPRNNFFVNVAAMGEGMHNFHHAFPFDYSIDEHGSPLNLGKRFIEIDARLGLANKLRRASPELIAKTKVRVLMETKKKQEDDPYINPLPY